MSQNHPCLPAHPCRYPLTQMAVIRISGPDRVKYLHSQVTCDVQALAAGAHSLGGYCDAKGKLWCDFRLVVLDEALLLLTKQTVAAKSLSELKKYGVFSKVEIEEISASLPCIGIAGIGSDEWVNKQFGLSTSGLLPGGAAVQVEADRWLLLGGPQAVDLPEQAEADWWGLEIAAGLPHMSGEHQGEYIPQMLNLQALGGISFTKGCYMGQETVARAKYRGANNRGLFILEGQGTHPVAPGAQLELKLDEQWKRSGLVLDCWQQGEALLLSAVLPLDTAPDGQWRLKEDPQSRLTLRPLPYSLAD
ncbi:MAG: tRNA-modifying protein YgfZ [Aeromonadaceae bacterium]